MHSVLDVLQGERVPQVNLACLGGLQRLPVVISVKDLLDTFDSRLASFVMMSTVVKGDIDVIVPAAVAMGERAIDSKKTGDRAAQAARSSCKERPGDDGGRAQQQHYYETIRCIYVTQHEKG